MIILDFLGQLASNIRVKDVADKKIYKLTQNSRVIAAREKLSQERSSMLASENIESKISELTNQNNSLQEEVIELRKQKTQLQRNITKLAEDDYVIPIDSKGTFVYGNVNVDQNLVKKIYERHDYKIIQKLFETAANSGGILSSLLNSYPTDLKSFLINNNLINKDGTALTKKGMSYKVYFSVVKSGHTPKQDPKIDNRQENPDGSIN